MYPNEENFEHKKQAFENSGMVVEATFVPGTNGQMVVAYGIRPKTWNESTCDHLRRNAPLYEMGRWGVDKAIDGTRLGVEINSYQELRRLNTTERRQNNILRGIGESVLGM